MQDNKVKVLAVVTARKGSVGIPNKNLKKVGGISLIARVASIIKKVPWITEAIITTDSERMRAEGVKNGLKAPFLRSAKLSTSFANGPDVLFDAWTRAEKFFQINFDFALYMEPTSPLRTVKDINQAFKMLINSNFDSVVSVSETPAHYSPEKTLQINKNKLSFYHSNGSKIHSRQKIPHYYHRNGAVYAVRRAPFFKNKKIITNNTGAYLIERNMVNIDDVFELELANWLLSR